MNTNTKTTFRVSVVHQQATKKINLKFRNVIRILVQICNGWDETYGRTGWGSATTTCTGGRPSSLASSRMGPGNSASRTSTWLQVIFCMDICEHSTHG